MALFQTQLKPVKAPQCNNIAAKIQQRRYQILVHSLIYYELDANIISDSQWSKWAVELVQLQEKHPDIASTVIFADAFKDFDGSTGFDLPYRDEQIVQIAKRLLAAQDSAESRAALIALQCITPYAPQYGGFYQHYPRKEPIKATQPTRKVVKKVEPTKRKKLF